MDSNCNKADKSLNLHQKYNKDEITTICDKIIPEKNINSKMNIISGSRKYIIWTQILGAVIIAVIHTGLGTSLALPGVILPQLTNPNTTDIYLNRDDAALFNSLIQGGAMVGSFSTGPLIVTLGQKYLLLGLLPLCLGVWILLGISHTVWIILLCRAFTGFVNGIMIDACTSYIVEFSHEEIRGKLVSIMDSARQFGYFFVYVVGSTSLTWRDTSFVCGTLTTIIPFIAMMFLPHSPRWLATKGRYDDVLKSLEFFRGKNYCNDSELLDIKNQIEKNQGSNSIIGQMKLICKRSIGLRVLLLIILMFFIQFNGNIIFITYTVYIFCATGSNINPYLATILSGAFRFIGALLFLFIGEKFPRRIIFMLCLTITSAVCALFGMYLYLKQIDIDLSHLNWLPMFLLCTFAITSGFVQPVISMLRNELLPNSVRPIGIGVSVVSLCIGGFIVTQLFLPIASTFGMEVAFWFYGVCGIFVLMIVQVFVPETKGKSLEEINEDIVNESCK